MVKPKLSGRAKFPVYRLDFGVISVGLNFYEFGLGFLCNYFKQFDDLFLVINILFIHIEFRMSPPE